MCNTTLKKNKGYSLIEVLVVIGLLTLFAGLTVSTFVSFSNYQSIDKDIDVIVSYIDKARNQTINAKDDDQYGIKFASTTVTLFRGTSYIAGSSTNQVYTVSNKVSLSSLQLTGGVTSFYFLPISGKPSATGTISYTLTNSASTTKTITVYGSGLIEAQ